MYQSFFLPTSIIIGTIIGAGIFSLPYVFSQAGIFMGIFYLVLFGAVGFILHLMYAEIITRTNEDHHRFPGYARIHLGVKAEWLASAVVLLTLSFTLTVYLILSVSFATLLAGDSISMFVKVVFFWLLGSATLFLGIRKAASFDFATTLITLAVILFIFIAGIFTWFLGVNHPVAGFIPSMFLIPFGPVLFSLLGEAAVPPVLVYFRKSGLALRGVRNVFLAGSFVPVIFYIMFVVGIIGLSQGNVSQDAVSGLAGLVPKAILFILGIFGFVSLWDSYATIGTDIKKILEYDWRMPHSLAGLVVVAVPLFLYFLGFQNFLDMVSLVGGFLFSVWAVLIVVIWKKSLSRESQHNFMPAFVYRYPTAVAAVLIILFLIGAGCVTFGGELTF